MLKVLTNALLVITIFWSSLALSNSIEEKFAQAVMSENLVRIRVLLRQVENINDVRYKGEDLLSLALRNGKDEAAEYLKSHGAVAQKSAAKAKSATPKPKVKPKAKPKEVKVVSKLSNAEVNWGKALLSANNIKDALSRGANPNAIYKGEGVLHHAAYTGRASVARELIVSGAGTSKLDKNNRTILHAFAMSPSQVGVQLALGYGVSEQQKDRFGNTYKTYLLASEKGQKIYKSLKIKDPTNNELINAGILAANSGDSRALRNILLSTKGKHEIDISSDMLTPEKFEIAFMLNRYGNIRAKRFIRGKTFYQVVSENYSKGYYLVALGLNPKPKTFLDLQTLGKLCETRDVMPILAAGGVTAETPLDEFDYANIGQFLELKCKVRQSLDLTDNTAKKQIASAVIPNQLISGLYLGSVK